MSAAAGGTRLVLAADVGGTKTNLALVETPSRGLLGETAAAATYRSADHPSLEAMIDAFRAGAGADAARSGAGSRPIAAATIGYAGAVAHGRGEGTNVPWSVDAAAMARHLGLKRVGLLNDLVATGYGIATLPDESRTLLLPGVADPDANAAVVAAGTGLGETILARVADDFVPIASEGGHADFAPRTDVELEVWRVLRERHGRVSVERLLSGPGLVNIAEVLHAAESSGGAAAWAGHRREAGDDERLPGLVSRNALQSSCPACARSLEVFVGIYGSEAGNAALRCVARGGVYLAGGIAPRILPALRAGAFERAFRDKAPHEALLASIPVWVVLDDRAALWGAARHASLSLD